MSEPLETRLGVGVAIAHVVEAVQPVADVERVPLDEALDRVLAEDALAPVALPPWDNSGMDGYAVRAADVLGATAEAPQSLAVVGTIAAGHAASRALGPGEAMRIMTGAPVPEGADTVIRVEDTDGGTSRVRVRDDRDARVPRRNVRPRGEDLQAGGVALSSGTALGPAQLGVLAACGMAEVPVWRRPRIAILATGDEVVELDRWNDVVTGARIPSTNTYTLRALVRQAGAIPVPLGIAGDTPEALRERLEAAAGCDLLLTTGGISVGAFDHVRPTLAAMGAELRFWRVRMRPGAPLGFGLMPDASRAGVRMPWLGLPGNPVSTMVTFELFARPAIRRLAGHTRLHRRAIEVVLEEPVTLAAPLTHFMRATLARRTDGRLGARLTGPQGSGLLTSMARADALVVIPPDAEQVDAGTTCRAILLGEAATYVTEAFA